MVSLGMGRGLSQGYTGSTPRRRPNVEVSGKVYLPNHDRGSGTRTHAKGDHDAFLQSATSILLRSRSARQDNVRLRPRPCRPRRTAQGSARRAGRLPHAGQLPPSPTGTWVEFSLSNPFSSPILFSGYCSAAFFDHTASTATRPRTFKKESIAGGNH